MKKRASSTSSACGTDGVGVPPRRRTSAACPYSRRPQASAVQADPAGRFPQRIVGPRTPRWSKPALEQNAAAMRCPMGAGTARPKNRLKPAGSLPIGAGMTFAGEPMVHLGHTGSGMLVLIRRSEFGRFGNRATLIKIEPLALTSTGADEEPETGS